jgi:3' exoribonuclease, RNase T-like
VKFFIDTEFSERGPKLPVELISIGIVREDGAFMYLVHGGFNAENCSAWVKENVLPRLGDGRVSSLEYIAHQLKAFIGSGKPEFWGYYSAYDWVVFCQIFGTMMDLPKGWPMYCRDIKQLCDSLGNPRLPEQGKGEHNALADARWNKRAYDFLMSLQGA